MKQKLIHLFIAIVALMAATACSSKSDKIREMVDEANADCPMYIGQGMTMQGCSYDGNELTIIYDFSEEYFSFEYITEGDIEDMEAVMTEMIKENNDKDVKEIRDICFEAKCDMRIMLTCGSDEISFVIPYQQLK